MRSRNELKIVFPVGMPIRMTPEAEAEARQRHHHGGARIFTGVVGRKLTMMNQWTGQIPVRLTGSRYCRLMPAERWEPDPNPPKAKEPPAKKPRKPKVAPVVVVVPEAPPKVVKPKRLEDLVFWEADPDSSGIRKLTTTLVHLTRAAESVLPSLPESERLALAQAVSSARHYLEPGT